MLCGPPKTTRLRTHAGREEKQNPPAQLDLYEKLIATIPAIQPKGAVHPYTSLNGHMFTYLDQTGTLGIRLAPDQVEASEEI
jgi:hypothetical protein